MGWEDIEKMHTINLREELLALLNKELEYIADISGPSSEDDDESFDAMRRNVCQWKYECVDYFQFDREVVYLSMNYFDRYLAKQTSMPSTALSHLLALSSLYVACKLHGVASAESSSSETSSETNSSPILNPGRVRIRLDDFCSMSRGTYCPQMLEEMELSLLANLQWKVHPPTPTDFLNRLMKILSLLLSNDQQINAGADHAGKGWSVFEVARYQIELAVYVPELSQQFLPSKIALAAILNAMDSKIIGTKRTIISPQIRHSFLQHLKCLGGGFAGLDVDGEDVVEARMTLKKLCSKTIVLPNQIIDESTSHDTSFAPITPEAKSFEYELPEVESLAGSSISPVCVATNF